MGYQKKSYTRKRRRRRKAGIWDRKVSLRQVWSKVKYLSSMINSEKKYFDYSQGSTTIAYDGAYSGCISQVLQGDGSTNRDGKSILGNSLLIRGTVAADTASTAPTVRFMLVCSKSYAGTAPTISNLLETGAASNSIYSPLAMGLNGKYWILKDFTIDLDSTDHPQKSFKILMKLPKSYHLKFDDSTNELTNSLWLLATSSLAAASSPPTLEFYSRLRFYDN